MGAAFDLMNENEGLQSKLNSKNAKIREQKKQLIDLSEAVMRFFSDEGDCTVYELENKAKTILNKLKKK